VAEAQDQMLRACVAQRVELVRRGQAIDPRERRRGLVRAIPELGILGRQAQRDTRAAATDQDRERVAQRGGASIAQRSRSV